MSKSKKMHQRILPLFFILIVTFIIIFILITTPQAVSLEFYGFFNNGYLSIGVEYLNTKLANQRLSR